MSDPSANPLAGSGAAAGKRGYGLDQTALQGRDKTQGRRTQGALASGRGTKWEKCE